MYLAKCRNIQFQHVYKCCPDHTLPVTIFPPVTPLSVKVGTISSMQKDTQQSLTVTKTGKVKYLDTYNPDS